MYLKNTEKTGKQEPEVQEHKVIDLPAKLSCKQL